MSEKRVHEIRVTHIDNLPYETKRKMVKRIVKEGFNSYKNYMYNFSEFVKITYVSTPKGIAIDSIDPIMGNIRDYFAHQRSKEVSIPIF